MRVVAIVQARMGSTRLPGKVMKRLAGHTVLSHVIRRLQVCRQVDQIVIATSAKKVDDTIVQEAKRHGVDCFRGSEEDVLERYYLAATEAGAEVVVRVTSDCPLLDPELIDRMISSFLSSDIDYLSNSLQRCYPRGLDAEIFTFSALTQACREAQHAHEREHVTPYIYHHPELFRLQNYGGREDLSNHRWTLDTEEDWALIEAIYDALYLENKALFSTEEVLRLLDRRPELVALNAHVEQKPLESE